MAVTALLVRIPEAEPLVVDLRLKHDPSAALGVPAHLTVLYPFLAPEEITDAVLSRLRAIFAAVRRFDVVLSAVGAWPQTTYLRPERSEPFLGLTTAVVAAFPTHLPYGGRFKDVVPHLTVADGDAAGARAVEAALQDRIRTSGAVRAICREVELHENSTGRWRLQHVFKLSIGTA